MLHRNSVKWGVLLLSVLLFAALAGGCVFGGTLTSYTLTYELCDSEEVPAHFEEGSNAPQTYTVGARYIELTAPTRNGYIFRGWYTDPDYSGISFTSLAPGTVGDLTLYARWEVTRPTGNDGGASDTDESWRGFLPYLEEFDSAYAMGANGTVTVESRDELTAYCEYVQYKYIEPSFAPTVVIDYDHGNVMLSMEVREVIDSAYFTSYIGLSWAQSFSSSSIKIGIKYADYADREATVTSSDNDYYTQIATYDYAERGAAHQFPIDSVTSQLHCSTSNQLFYAAMIGAQPIPEEGSAADEIYTEARTVLSRIVNDGMEDYEKARAIYDWLVMNVTYDQQVLIDNINIPEAIKYDAFYLEGVFGSGRAVCDGISKAMTLLCRIEGVPCVRVVGTDHAWNKLYINGNWYVADATFGDTTTEINGGNYSFLTHRSFLTIDTADERYATATNYTAAEYAAPTSFDFYRYEFFDTGSTRANFVIESATEFRELYSWAISLKIKEPFTVDFYTVDSSYIVTAGRHAIDADGHHVVLMFNI